MNWIPLENEQSLDQLVAASANTPQVIFKHSTRCSISTVAKGRLEKAAAPSGVAFYYLDLLKYRPVSNEIASRFGVVHQSPQVLVISNGRCVYAESHLDIEMDAIAGSLQLS